MSDSTEFAWNVALSKVMDKHATSSGADTIRNLGTIRAVNHMLAESAWDPDKALPELASGAFNDSLRDDLLLLIVDGLRDSVQPGAMIGLLDMVIFQYQKTLSNVAAAESALEASFAKENGVH